MVSFKPNVSEFHSLAPPYTLSHITHALQVTVVSPDEVSAEDLAKEREVQMGMEDLKARPEHLRWVVGLPVSHV